MKMANIITCLRIICGIAIVFFNPFSQGFYLLYIVGGLSDVFDGIVARKLKEESKFGARLDTIADIVFVIAVLAKIINAVFFPTWVIIWIICISVMKIINIVSGVIVSGHFVSEHTVLNKICGVCLFALPFCNGVFSGQWFTILSALICSIATIAAMHEGHYIHVKKEVD